MNVPETFFSVSEELTLFGISCLFGLLIGVCYDFFRAVRLIFPHNFFLIMLEDILFLAGYAVFLSAFSSAAARGELRFYYVVGNFIGFVVYLVTVGSVVAGTVKKVFYALKKVISIIFLPLRSSFVFLRRKVSAKFVGSSKVLVNYIKKSKMLLLKRPHLLYNKNENKKGKNVTTVGKKVKSE